MHTQKTNQNNQKTIFFTLVSTERQKNSARLLVKSLRSFGGSLSECPIWIFVADPQLTTGGDLTGVGVQVIQLHIPETIRDYWFAGKVSACARAEELAGGEVDSLVWLSTDCLIVKPPMLFELGSLFDIALRPVHIRNVGLLAADPLDSFWRIICETIGVVDIRGAVQSFVDEAQLRPYYNSHALSINPSIGFFNHWFEYFERLVGHVSFQSGPCHDDLHQIFLHQAVLSTLIASMVDPDRIRILPEDYSYPYNLHAQVPESKRANALNDLVCFTYEDRPLDPYVMDDIKIDEPLKSWLVGEIKKFH